MPMIPEAAIAMLGCARIGAVHSVVFGGFSSDSLADRVNDAEAIGREASDYHILGADGTTHALGLISKRELASSLLDHIETGSG